jgi:hypothetical protein
VSTFDASQPLRKPASGPQLIAPAPPHVTRYLALRPNPQPMRAMRPRRSPTGRRGRHRRGSPTASPLAAPIRHLVWVRGKS